MNDVTEPAALVTLNGVPQDVVSVSVSRELSSSLPAQVTSASGLTAATGSVEWAVGDDVERRSAHPWDGNDFPPKPADAVVVFMGYGDILDRQLTGVADSSNGSIASGSVSSDLVDRIDKLNQPVTFPAHLATFPPHAENGAFLPVGNEPTYTTDRVLRACGFNATPPMSTSCVLSVPFMGSAWPERGTVTASGQNGYPSFPPSHTTTQWGVGTNSCDASYTPDLSKAGGNGKIDRAFQITFKVRNTTGTASTAYARAYWGTDYLQFAVSSSRILTAQINKGTTVTVCTMTAADAATADVFTMRVEPSGTFTILANNGATVSGTATLSAAMTTTNMLSARVATPHLTGVTLGGLQMNFGSTSVYNSAQTATLTPAAYSFSLPAFPRIDNRVALDVLKEQAAAECAAMWIDEQGVFRWVNRDVLTGAAPVATLTALDDILDIGWESDAQGIRSKVLLNYREAAISRSDVSNQSAWQGSGQSLEAGQTNVEFVEPGADIDWIGVDESMPKVTTTAGWPSKFNKGHGSWYGGVEVNDTTERWAHLTNPGFGVTLEKVGSFVYKITTIAGTPEAGYNIDLRAVDDPTSSVVRKSRRNMELPVLRAKTIVEWTDKRVTAAQVGPPDAAALEHGVGPWVQDSTALTTLADWLALQVSAPKPVLRDLSVIPDFARKLGDIVWIEDPDNMRVRLRVLVTKISNTVADGSADQTIGGTILEVQGYGPTNKQLDTHSASRTNASFTTLWADATNAALDANPLGRG